MNEGGFLPLTALGVIILVLAVSTAGYYHWAGNRNEMRRIRRSADSSLTVSCARLEDDIETQLLEDFHDALWKIGKNSYRFRNGRGREVRIEKLLKSQLDVRLGSLREIQKRRPEGPDLSLGEENIEVDMDRGERGFPVLSVHLPENSLVYDELPDGSTSLALSLENLFATADARYYLLQDRMNEFVEGFESIGRRWAFSEYALAYLEVWGQNKLKLSERRSKALFNLALATHEIDKFGSTDYIELAQDLSGVDLTEKLLDNWDNEVAVRPLRDENIRILQDRIEDSLDMLERSTFSLKESLRSIADIGSFDPMSWYRNRQRRVSKILERIGDFEDGRLVDDFWGICSEFKDVYNFPRLRVKKALKRVRTAAEAVSNSRSEFRGMMSFLKKLGNSNKMMKQLYSNLTREDSPPGVYYQVERGVEKVKENLIRLEKQLEDLMRSLTVGENVKRRFPDGYADDFESSLVENNYVTAREVLTDAVNSARAAFRDFNERISKGWKDSERFREMFRGEVSRQLSEPRNNWSKNYMEYSEPGDDDYENRISTVEKYVIRRDDGTIAGLKKVLSGVESQLERLGSINKKIERSKGSLEQFDISDKLGAALSGNFDFQVPTELTREEYYELAPPSPLYSDPGLSVYHEVEVENVEFDRVDPVGFLSDGRASFPTPVYLWFIDTVLYWTSWNITLHLKSPLIEEIYDYRNRNIPRPMGASLSGVPDYAHQPLPFKQKFEENEFSFHLATLSLRFYEVSQPSNS